MPYKNKEKQKQAKHESYLRNKHKIIDSNRKRRKEYREWFRELRSTLSCKECEENHPATLDFHHPDNNKEANVSRLVRSLYPKKRILAEIAKCIVLCANCHRKIHYIEE